MEEISSMLKGKLKEKGASLVGFADLSQLPVEQRSGMNYGISMAVALDPEIVKGIQSAPTPEYYEEYKRVNKKLDGLVEYAGQLLHEHGYQAVLKTTTEVVIDPNSHSSVLPHKTVATRAGIGWIGKCALLVTEEFGSAIRISTVLTNAPLHTGSPINESRCGACDLCKQACPGDAPLGVNWDVSKTRDEFFNAHQCRKTAREKAAQIGIEATICGKCIAVCPWTNRYLERA